MATMQSVIDNVRPGDVVFFATPDLIEMSSLCQNIESGEVIEIEPDDHGIALNEAGWPWESKQDVYALYRRFHDVDEIILAIDDMQEMLWHAYHDACWRSRERFPNVSQMASVFGFDAVGHPLVGFAHVSEYDEYGNVDFAFLPTMLEEYNGGHIEAIEVFDAEDGNALVASCVEMVRGYFV